MSSISDTCACEILDVVPLIMRAIRMEMRSHRDSSLSIPQFRALLFVHRNLGTSLSQVAEHLGLTAPTTSKMVDGLVTRELISRKVMQGNRRRVTLTLLPHGEAMLKTAQAETQKKLSTSIATLSDKDLQKTIEAMLILKNIFAKVARE